MWTHCTFCSRDLGRNEVVETFPVGRRLAFDAAKGRLWVVCKRCGGWNLTPLEERWEAVEDCEACFRETRVRFSTGELGLARLREGLELVRIGRPLRPEFATWRYGDRFGRRRRRALLKAGGVAVAGGAALVGGVVTASGIAVLGGLGWNLYARRTVVRLSAPDGRVLRLRPREMQLTSLREREPAEPGELPWSVSVMHRGERVVLSGGKALRATTRIVRAVNSLGARAGTVHDAVDRLATNGGAERFLRTFVDSRLAPPGLLEYMFVDRKALHESREEEALGGELRLLEEAWKDAEEVAAIADGLLLPAGADEFVERERSS